MARFKLYKPNLRIQGKSGAYFFTVGAQVGHCRGGINYVYIINLLFLISTLIINISVGNIKL